MGDKILRHAHTATVNNETLQAQSRSEQDWLRNDLSARENPELGSTRQVSYAIALWPAPGRGRVHRSGGDQTPHSSSDSGISPPPSRGKPALLSSLPLH